MSTPSCLPARPCFGSFELDLTSGELRRAGQKIALPPKAFEVLKALLERPGEVITREELRARLWPADTFVEFDDSLNHAVKKLRLALGDAAEDPEFIETLPRYGYRFIASRLRTTEPESEIPSPAAPAFTKRSFQSLARRLGVSAGLLSDLHPAAGPGAGSMSRRLWLALAASALIVAAVGMAFDAKGLRTRLIGSVRTPAPSIRLAVLPFENLTG